jgi:hypothetical protein
MGVDARCSKNVIRWRRAGDRDDRVFCKRNPITSGKACERRRPSRLCYGAVSMKLSRANGTRFTWQKWACPASSEHATRWVRRPGPACGKGPGIFGQPLKNEGWGFQALENPRHTSATKMRSNSCASSTGKLSCSFRANCLTLCLLTGSVITDHPSLDTSDDRNLSALVMPNDMPLCQVQ